MKFYLSNIGTMEITQHRPTTFELLVTPFDKSLPSQELWYEKDSLFVIGMHFNDIIRFTDVYSEENLMDCSLTFNELREVFEFVTQLMKWKELWLPIQRKIA